MGYDFVVVVGTIHIHMLAYELKNEANTGRPPATPLHAHGIWETSPSKLIRRMSSSRPRVEVVAAGAALRRTWIAAAGLKCNS
jgi:hypothetical protein